MRWVFVIVVAAGVLLSCEQKELEEKITILTQDNDKLKEQNLQLKKSIQLLKGSQGKLYFLTNAMAHKKASIITNYGTIELEFFPEKAPLHCFNFITRAESGFYDNTQFHRVIPGFMIQGGDPLTKGKDKSFYGMGGPKVNIPNEFNDLHHKPGILSMARTNDIQAGAGSQFFIMHADRPDLDNLYTIFGQVTKGMDVVNKIANVKRDGKNLPLKAVRIKTIKIM